MYSNGYADEVLLEDVDNTSVPNYYKWIKRLLIAFLIFILLVIFVSVPQNLIVICLLIWLNLVIITFAVWQFMQKGTLAAMIPVMFLPYVTASCLISPLYFAIFDPEHSYPVDNEAKHISFFYSGVKYQLCVLLFLAGYLGVMFYLLRKEGQRPQGVVANPRLLAYSTALLDLSVVLFVAVACLVKLSEFLWYLAFGLFKYFWGLLFIAGVFIKKIVLSAKLLLIMCLVMSVLFLTVGNARGYALFTILPFILGIVFFSEYSRKTRITIFICLLSFLPVYLSVSNLTRVLTGGIGFEDFWYRASLFKEWRTFVSERSAIAVSLDRIFSKSGHSIITRTPSEVPYHYFDLLLFLKEAIVTLLPQQYFYYPPYYGNVGLLTAYGFLIIEGVTSTEISIISSFWMMGGWVWIILGGICLGLLHGFLVKIIQRNSMRSMMKALIYFCFFTPQLIWGPNLCIMMHFHIVIYSIVMAFIFYQILRLIIGDPGRGMYQPDNEELAIYAEQV